MPVCAHGATGRILMKLDILAFFQKSVDILAFFQKSVEKIQVSLKGDKPDRYFTLRRFHVYDSMSLNYS